MALVGSQQALAMALFEIGAFLYSDEGFLLKEHETNPKLPRSPHRFNIRIPGHSTKPGPVTPEVLQLIGTSLAKKAAMLQFGYDHLLGLPEAGEPIAEAMSDARLSGPASILKMRKVREDGKRRLAGPIIGNYQKGDRVLLIDELTTAGCTKCEAITVVEADGLRVAGVLTVIDREQGGSDFLRQRGYRCESVMTATDFIQFGVEHKYITPEQRRRILEYLAEYHRILRDDA